MVTSAIVRVLVLVLVLVLGCLQEASGFHARRVSISSLRSIWIGRLAERGRSSAMFTLQSQEIINNRLHALNVQTEPMDCADFSVGSAIKTDDIAVAPKYRLNVARFLPECLFVFRSMGIQLASAATKTAPVLNAALSETTKRRRSSFAVFIHKMIHAAELRRVIKKVGDRRVNSSSLVINGISTFFLISVFVALSAWWHKARSETYFERMRKEVLRERMYRENMYFEAVQELQGQLQGKEVSERVKKSIEKDILELDPKGKIRDFLAGKISRPDISDSLAPKPKPKKSDKEIKTASLATRQHQTIDLLVRTLKMSSMENESILQLARFLNERLDAIVDLDKRELALTKIDERRDDFDYWETYHQKHLSHEPIMFPKIF